MNAERFKISYAAVYFVIASIVNSSLQFPWFVRQKGIKGKERGEEKRLSFLHSGKTINGLRIKETHGILLMVISVDINVNQFKKLRGEKLKCNRAYNSALFPSLILRSLYFTCEPRDVCLMHDGFCVILNNMHMLRKTLSLCEKNNLDTLDSSMSVQCWKFHKQKSRNSLQIWNWTNPGEHTWLRPSSYFLAKIQLNTSYKQPQFTCFRSEFQCLKIKSAESFFNIP